MQDDARLEAKKKTNRKAYEKSKKSTDAALLRLDKGDLQRLDAACAAAGLGRSAYAKLYLLPLADVISVHHAQIKRVQMAGGLSLATFLDRAVAQAVAAPDVQAADINASTEFDALFLNPSSEGSS